MQPGLKRRAKTSPFDEEAIKNHDIQPGRCRHKITQCPFEFLWPVKIEEVLASWYNDTSVEEVYAKHAEVEMANILRAWLFWNPDPANTGWNGVKTFSKGDGLDVEWFLDKMSTNARNNYHSVNKKLKLKVGTLTLCLETRGQNFDLPRINDP